MRLYSRHFHTGDFIVTAGGQRRLNKGAVPSLFVLERLYHTRTKA
uniref:Uncharacterized protein n=1 Tax=Anguilla anguilla TaxID=7936 RepID=A0A0E9T7H7_ANGAN